MTKELFLQLCGYACAAITMVSYIPQIVKTMKTKKADDLSKGSWTLWLMGAVIWEIYALVDGGIGLVVAQTLELLMILTVFVLAVLYGTSRKGI